MRYAIHSLGKLVSVRWDLYHRSIRDVKLSLLHSSSGVFLQAQMHSQYLWALSYRPFSTSGFHEDKLRCLEVMMGRETPETCQLFQDVWETIRDDLGMPPWSNECDVWKAMPDVGAFASKGTLPKLSRWFSWNQSYEEQISSWNVLKLALAYHFQGQDIDPDTAAQKRELDALARLDADGKEEKMNVRKQFSLLKEKLGGGLKLAYHLMSFRLLQLVHIIAMVTRPIWSWYSQSVKSMCGSNDLIDRLVQLASSWASDRHLQETASVCTSKPSEMITLLHRPEFSEFQDTASKSFELAGRLLQNRAWSLAKASSPPDCYAEILSTDRVKQQAAQAQSNPYTICCTHS